MATATQGKAAPAPSGKPEAPPQAGEPETYRAGALMFRFWLICIVIMVVSGLLDWIARLVSR